MYHLNGFEILKLIYILHDGISEVSDWNELFHWIAREFKIVDDVMSTMIWFFTTTWSLLQLHVKFTTAPSCLHDLGEFALS